MGNNIKELRLAFLLTPSELAARMGADAEQVKRLEAAKRDLDEEWIESVANALGVPLSAITDPDADIRTIAANAVPVQTKPIVTCPIGARFAIQAMVAKLGGLKVALALSEDDLATAVNNLQKYAEKSDGKGTPEQQINRLTQGLQIVVLTVLQSREVDPGQDFSNAMAKTLKGAMSLLQAFSAVDQSAHVQEV